MGKEGELQNEKGKRKRKEREGEGGAGNKVDLEKINQKSKIKPN